jgi:hypothetical protein
MNFLKWLCAKLTWDAPPTEYPDDWIPGTGPWMYVSQCHCGHVPEEEDMQLVESPCTCARCGCRNRWSDIVLRKDYEWSPSRHMRDPEMFLMYARNQKFVRQQDHSCTAEEKI